MLAYFETAFSFNSLSRYSTIFLISSKGSSSFKGSCTAPFTGMIGFQFLFIRRNRTGCWIEADMIPACRIVHQYFAFSDGRHVIADALNANRYSFLQQLPDGIESWLYCFILQTNIFINTAVFHWIPFRVTIPLGTDVSSKVRDVSLRHSSIGNVFLISLRSSVSV